MGMTATAPLTLDFTGGRVDLRGLLDIVPARLELMLGTGKPVVLRAVFLRLSVLLKLRRRFFLLQPADAPDGVNAAPAVSRGSSSASASLTSTALGDNEDAGAGAGTDGPNGPGANALEAGTDASSSGTRTLISQDNSKTETNGMTSKPLNAKFQILYRIAAEARRNKTVASHAALSRSVAFSNTSMMTSRARVA